jgi:hypothetical protein
MKNTAFAWCAIAIACLVVFGFIANQRDAQSPLHGTAQEKRALKEALDAQLVWQHMVLNIMVGCDRHKPCQPRVNPRLPRGRGHQILARAQLVNRLALRSHDEELGDMAGEVRFMTETLPTIYGRCMLREGNIKRDSTADYDGHEMYCYWPPGEDPLVLLDHLMSKSDRMRFHIDPEMGDASKENDRAFFVQGWTASLLKTETLSKDLFGKLGVDRKVEERLALTRASGSTKAK